MAHRPVLLDQALDALQLQDGGVYVDATFGGGGYSRPMLDAAACRVIAFDRDPDAVTRARALADERAAFTILHAPFGEMRGALARVGVRAVDAVGRGVECGRSIGADWSSLCAMLRAANMRRFAEDRDEL